MNDSTLLSNRVDRRTFLSRATVVTAGLVASNSTAYSYSRILGANDRISLGHIGVGNRGRGLAWIVSQLKDRCNVEMTAVCDLWKVNREKAVVSAGKAYGRSPRSFQFMEEMLAVKDLDGVIISTADFQHAPHLKTVAEAGKHAYCEKPMANSLEEAKAARDVVSANHLIVQIGTQRRSEPYQINAKEFLKTGVCGDISKVEVVWNYNGPRWRGRPEVNQIREAETDWRRWLLDKPYRPFDPQVYFEFRLYKEFSTGIVDQWMTHGIDMVHWFMDDHFPVSAVAHGGVFAWKDGRENPDTFQALLEYPKGFLVSYSTSYGNDVESFIRFMGKKGTLINRGTEGTPQWKWIEEKGNYEDDPYLQRSEKVLSLAGDKGKPPGMTPDEDLSHMHNWLDCLRHNKPPNATVQAGYAHSVACIMSARAQREGKKLYWDPKNEEILDHFPTS